jgi:hypothetical protein
MDLDLLSCTDTGTEGWQRKEADEPAGTQRIVINPISAELSGRLIDCTCPVTANVSCGAGAARWREGTMSERAEELAGRFERAIEEFVGVVAGLSAQQWRLRCRDEERSVGVVARHVAKGIPFEMAVFRQIAAGERPATITRAQLDAMNARDAAAWTGSSKEETVALLREYAAAAASEVRGWSDAQLGRSGKYLEELPEAWTVDAWIERILIGHVTGHLGSVRAALAAEGAGT